MSRDELVGRGKRSKDVYVLGEPLRLCEAHAANYKEGEYVIVCVERSLHCEDCLLEAERKAEGDR